MLDPVSGITESKPTLTGCYHLLLQTLRNDIKKLKFVGMKVIVLLQYFQEHDAVDFCLKLKLMNADTEGLFRLIFGHTKERLTLEWYCT